MPNPEGHDVIPYIPGEVSGADGTLSEGAQVYLT